MTSCRLKHVVDNPVLKAEVNGVGRIDMEDVASADALLVSTEVERSSRVGEGVVFEAGDVLFGKLRPYLRKTLLCPGPGLCSPELLVLRPHPQHLDPRFLHYIVRSAPFVAFANATSKGTKMPRTDFEAIGQYKVDLPALNEQRRIADFLDAESGALDRLIARKHSLLSLLVKKRVSVGLAAASGELTSDPSGRTKSVLTWLPATPPHWRAVKLSLVARLGTGHTPDRSQSRYWGVDRDIPWLTTSDIERFRDDRRDVLVETKESISRLGLENSAAVLHPAGTVALSRTASVGFSVIMGRDMATSQDFVTWTCSKRLEPRFLLLCLRAMRPDLLEKLAMGSTHKTIYMPDLQGLRVPLPPLDEQKRAADLAQEVMHDIDGTSALIARQLPLLHERRNALITAAVGGELDPSSYRASAVAA